MGYLGDSVVKNPPANEGDIGLIPGLRRSPGGNGNSFQYSCLENSMDRGAWQVIVVELQRVGHKNKTIYDLNFLEKE